MTRVRREMREAWVVEVDGRAMMFGAAEEAYREAAYHRVKDRKVRAYSCDIGKTLRRLARYLAFLDAREEQQRSAETRRYYLSMLRDGGLHMTAEDRCELAELEREGE